MPQPEQLVGQLVRLAHAQFDMRSARALGDELVKHHGNIDAWTYGIFTGFVVSYARPFTDSTAYGRLEGKWSKFPNRPDLKKLHDRLIGLRHQLLAHTDETPHRKVGVFTRGAFLEDRPAVVEGRSAIDERGIREALALLDFQEDRFGEAAQSLALRLQELGYWPDGVMLELDASGFTVVANPLV